MRLGVFADSHVTVERFDPAAWHNPYRLRDSLDRLRRALGHPLLDGVDAVVGLGDLAHFGDRASLIAVVEAVAERGVPAILLSGNHDVIEDDVRLAPIVDGHGRGSIATALGEWPAVVSDALARSRMQVSCHEVTGTWPQPDRPFSVTGRTRFPEPGRAELVCSHFPVVGLRREAAREGLLYAGHLADLADPDGLAPRGAPAVVLSGHLHLRGIAVEGPTLQIVFAALVEDPFDVAAVDIEAASGDDVTVSYECASVAGSTAERIPVLVPAAGRWSWDGEAWHGAVPARRR